MWVGGQGRVRIIAERALILGVKMRSGQGGGGRGGGEAGEGPGPHVEGQAPAFRSLLQHLCAECPGAVSQLLVCTGGRVVRVRWE